MAGYRLFAAMASIALAAAQTPEVEEPPKKTPAKPPKRCLFRDWANLINFEIQVENVAPEGGVCQSPVWMGIHKGDFDLFSQGEVSEELQAATRSGDVTTINPRFKESPSAVGETVVGEGPICPGEVAKTSIVVNMPKGETSYLSFLSTVLPCRGAFVGNEASVAEIVFNKQGFFSFRPFTVPGTQVFRADGGAGEPLPTDEDEEVGGRSGQGEQAVGRATSGCDVSEDLVPDGRSFSNINFNVPDYEMLKVTITKRRPVCPKAVASIKPKRVVPKIKKTESKAGGQINLRYFEEGGLFYAIQVGQLRQYKACTLNMGKPGRNGEPIVELVNKDEKGSLSIAFRGFINEEDILMEDFTKEDIWKAIGERNVYVVCTTDKFPEGEVRGDLNFA